MCKVSVIVPVYNVEKYLVKCLDSIINQTYKDIEIILVDDGSTDNSGKICDKYALKDERIYVIHNSNSGVSYARNCGINKAKGKYILFIDSDDFIDKNYVQELMFPIQREDYDLVICNVNDFYIDKNINECRNIKEELLIGNFFDDYWYLINLLRVPVVKLYKTDIIKTYNILFPENIVSGEDQIFNFKYYNFVRKYKFINKALYNYFHRENNSLSKIRTLKTFEMLKEKLYIERDFLETKKVKNRELILNNHIIDTVVNFSVLEQYNNSYKDFKRRILDLKKILYETDKYSNIKRYFTMKGLKNNIIFPIYCYCILKYYKKKYFM